MSSSTSPPDKGTSVLFVCLGNICRSPLAEAVFRDQLKAPDAPNVSRVDSCGTGAYHEGSEPDARSLAVLKKQGVRGYVHRARKIQARDFDDFAWIFAMDADNLENLLAMRSRIAQKRTAGDEGLARVMLFGAYSGDGRDEEVRDPYYGGAHGFDAAYEQVQRFSKNFLRQLRTSESEAEA